ncbi:SET and MYND domain-containing protein 4 [Nasonia vitripennis]|uniref:SET and MYND domain-containing protein 4 n=1 Tax=Nasonia vitripennis TaxID=7425 RepID=A0A7M7LQD1_NASVI|nr:SET and MYND domain-containing protein 4 [Nasonia vitripennis]
MDLKSRLLFDFEVAEEEKKGNVLRKCSAASTNLRTSGNKLYRSKNHDKRTHENILSLYSESIAFAPVDSEELALAYSNRSALLLHLHYPEKSLIDIVKALGITKSTYLRTKLLSRKAKCLELIKKSADREDNSSDELKIPTFTPSKQLPCVADCVKVDYNKQFGRHMVATRDIEPGEVIIAETGHVVFPSGEQMYLNCSNCLRLAWTGIPCDFCAFAIFCSETCKKEAWNAYHDIECCIMSHVFLKHTEKSFWTHVMIVARILIKAVKREGLKNILSTAESMDKQDICAKRVWSNDGYNCATFRFCYSLLSHNNCMVKDYGYILNLQAEVILKLLYKYTSIFNTFQKSDVRESSDDTGIFLTTKKLFVKLRNIVNANIFGYQIIEDDRYNDKNIIQLSELTVKGLLLAPCSSFINHSCYPNVSKIFMPKGKIVMMSVLPVKKGEQLYCNYGTNLSEETKERQSYLQSNYFFKCECLPCKNNWTFESMRKIVPTYDLNNDLKFIKEFKKMYSMRLNGESKDWPIDPEAIKEAKDICKLIQKYLQSHILPQYSMRYAFFLECAFRKLYEEKCSIPHSC